jgi:hypothetical protein
MSDVTDTVNAIANAPGDKPEARRKVFIPEVRDFADTVDATNACNQIATFMDEKLRIAISKTREISNQARTLPPPQYPSCSTDAKGSDAGKNMGFANLLVKSFRFGHIGKTLYVQHDLIFTPLLEKDFDLLLRLAALRNDLPEELQKSISSYKSSELYAWLLAHPAVKDLPEMPDKRYVAVQNGILDLKKKKLLHLKDFSGEKTLPVLYNRVNANYIRYTIEDWNSSNTYSYLNRLAHPDCREKCVNALLYLNGKICSNDRSGKNLYHLWGPSNNGKSVYAAYTQSIVGTGNFGNLSLKDMTMQFSMINLRHALVNISTDEDTDAWNSSIASLIKRITGHDTLQVDVKYERMQQFRPYCVLLCMGNAEPRYSKDLDAGAAISKRLFLIPTGPTVLEPDEDLLEKKLLPEKDLLFSVAIDYFMNHDHPDKIVDMEEIVAPGILPKELFSCWVNDCVEINDSSEKFLTEDLWNNYCVYVKNMPGSSRMNRRTFEMACAVRLSGNKSTSRSHNRSCYIGLKLKMKLYDPSGNSDFGEW